FAVRINPNPYWFTVSPQTISVPPGASASFNVTLDTRDLPFARYEGSLQLTADQGWATPVVVPVTLTLNEPPQVAFQVPANYSFYLAGADVPLVASATDPDGISKVEFFDGTTKLGETSAAPYSLLWAGATPGKHEVAAKATALNGTYRSSARLT